MINEFGGVVFVDEFANRPPEEWERDREVSPGGLWTIGRWYDLTPENGFGYFAAPRTDWYKPLVVPFLSIMARRQVERAALAEMYPLLIVTGVNREARTVTISAVDPEPPAKTSRRPSFIPTPRLDGRRR